MTPQNATPSQQSAALSERAMRGTLYTLGASTITLSLGLLRSVLLARFLLPEHFGVVALALVYLSLVARLHDFGIDMALIHRRETDEAVLRTAGTLRIGLDVLAYGTLLLLAPLLQQAYPHMATLHQVLPPLILATFLGSLSNFQAAFLRRELAFRSLALIDVLASLGMTTIAPFLAWRGYGAWALVAEELSGLSIRFLLTWLPLRRWRPRFGWDRIAWRWLWEYGRSVWVAGNLDFVLAQFDDFWVGTALGAAALGFYSKAYELAGYPRRILANPLITVLGPTFARLQDDRLALSQMFYRSAHLIWRTGLYTSGALALLLPEFIHGVIGDKWLPMLWTFRLMLVYCALDPLAAQIDRLLMMVGRPQALRRSRVWQTAFFLPAVLLGAWLGGINGVALAADGMLLLGFWRQYGPLRRAVDFSLPRLLLWPLATVALAWVGGLAIEALFHGTLWQMALLKLGIFSLLYAGPLLLLERNSYLQGLRWAWSLLRRPAVSD